MTLSKVERLVGKMDSGEPALGMLNMSYSAELVEILGYVGFDFIYADQMFTSIGWTELANMVRAADGSQLAVFARRTTRGIAATIRASRRACGACAITGST